MKKIFLILLVPAILFFSCNKESDNNYHVSFNVNGTAKSYTAHTLAHLEDLGGGNFELVILGAASATSYDDYLGIYINNSPGGGTIPAGQYQDNSTSYTVLTTYQNSGSEYEAGQSVAEDGIAYNVPIANHFTVNITTLTTNGVARGTFSGDYYQNGDVQSTKINITNGEFYVKFQ
jgi:hypothetical protein